MRTEQIGDAMLERETRESDQPALFEDMDEDWRGHWWGMPTFEMGDATPGYQVTMNFLTAADLKAFAERVGIPLTTASDSAWYPDQRPLKASTYEYQGEPTGSKYPICIPSKGRADCQKTGRVLDRMGVPYRFFVEDTEADEYLAALGPERVVVMPFNNLGQGSIPARNFIWDWAKERGYKRHWVVDDNIKAFARCHRNRRLVVRGGGFFRAIEGFVDRYENVALAGPHEKGFVRDRDPNVTPYLMNSRVYSCILIDTALSHRWRGRYNEDTDLSLRVLKDGLCTVLFRALVMDKHDTAFSSGKALKGGNTDTVYSGGDHRRAFAESLAEQHPDVARVTWKFGRWHHEVNYRPFRGNKLKLRAGIVPTVGPNEHGMRLVRVADGLLLT